MAAHNKLHASEHTDGSTDPIPEATNSSRGLASAAQITKLEGIEALADVTDATNVAAAGATMDNDTSLAGNGYFLDEDNMASNDDTKVPSQQSVKAYVDAAVVGLYDHKGAYDADTNSPDLDTTPSGIKKGDAYTVSVAGTFFTESVEVGDVLIADQDDPTTLAHWTRVNKNISFGTSAGTACEGNDSRLSDARTPTAHASSHQHSGGDEIATATPGANAIPKADGSGTLNSWVTAAGTQQVVTLTGATPTDAEFAGWADDTGGYAIGTGSRIWNVFKRSGEVYYVELTAL